MIKEFHFVNEKSTFYTFKFLIIHYTVYTVIHACTVR